MKRWAFNFHPYNPSSSIHAPFVCHSLVTLSSCRILLPWIPKSAGFHFSSISVFLRDREMEEVFRQQATSSAINFVNIKGEQNSQRSFLLTASRRAAPCELLHSYVQVQPHAPPKSSFGLWSFDFSDIALKQSWNNSLQCFLSARRPFQIMNLIFGPNLVG